MMRKKFESNIKLDRSIFTNALILTLLVGLIFVAYIFGSSNGYVKGKKIGISEGKETGQIELLQAQRKSAEDAIMAAQNRLKEGQDASAPKDIKNPIEDTLSQPFGTPLVNPLNN